MLARTESNLSRQRIPLCERQVINNEFIFNKYNEIIFYRMRVYWYGFLSNANQELKTCLIEEYSNENKPGEGEIYRKIRQYHFQRNLSFEN